MNRREFITLLGKKQRSNRAWCPETRGLENPIAAACRLLRRRCERPYDRCASDECDEFPPPHGLPREGTLTIADLRVRRVPRTTAKSTMDVRDGWSRTEVFITRSARPQ